jgi:two-component system sensor histidine kinase KdpD
VTADPRPGLADTLEALADVIGSPDLPAAVAGIEGIVRAAVGAARVEVRLAPGGRPAEAAGDQEPGSAEATRTTAGDDAAGHQLGSAHRLERPLRSRDGRHLGWVAVTPSGDRDLPAADARLLDALLDAAGAALDRHQLVAALEDAQAQRQAFFGVVSHELRTPITTIYGGTRVLRQSGGRLSHDAREQLLDDISDEAERLYRLVEDLLVLSRAEREGLVVAAEPILLQHVVARVVSSEQQRWPRTTLRSDAGRGLPPVLGDSTLVEQVLRNLISNAAKYAGDAGAIDITAAHVGGWVEVRVLDQGPGLDPAEAARVFDLFYRGSDAASRAQGAGIGLYACRQLVVAMGGDIWVEQRPTGGAEFGFRLTAERGDDDGPRPVASDRASVELVHPEQG